VSKLPDKNDNLYQPEDLKANKMACAKKCAFSVKNQLRPMMLVERKSYD